MPRRYLKIVADVAVDAVLFDDNGIPTEWKDHDSFVESDEPIGSTVVDGVITPPPPPPTPTPPTAQEIADSLDQLDLEIDTLKLFFMAFLRRYAIRENIPIATLIQTLKADVATRVTQIRGG